MTYKVTSEVDTAIQTSGGGHQDADGHATKRRDERLRADRAMTRLVHQAFVSRISLRGLNERWT